MRLAGALFIVMALPVFGQYSAQREGDVVRLVDSRRQMSVGVLPSRGNMAFEFTVKGKAVLHSPFARSGGIQGRPRRPDGHPVPGAVG